VSNKSSRGVSFVCRHFKRATRLALTRLPAQINSMNCAVALDCISFYKEVLSLFLSDSQQGSPGLRCMRKIATLFCVLAFATSIHVLLQRSDSDSSPSTTLPTPQASSQSQLTSAPEKRYDVTRSQVAEPAPSIFSQTKLPSPLEHKVQAFQMPQTVPSPRRPIPFSSKLGLLKR